jgi:micrococcal nuclease
VLAILLILPMLGLMQGNITHVTDGDTIVANNNQTIRLAMVDAQELKDFGYFDAKNFVIWHCLNKYAKIDVDDKQPFDRYNRTVAMVKCGHDHSTINQYLLKNDYAVLVRSYCDKSEFSSKSWIKC